LVEEIAVVATPNGVRMRLGFRQACLPQPARAPRSELPLLRYILAIVSFILVSLAGCSGGNATGTIQHSATLTWTASTSGVAGYNVYRGVQSGGPYTRINSVLEAPTNYVDNTVQPGCTYYYVVTAVDSNGLESAYSNEVVAVIPIP